MKEINFTLSSAFIFIYKHNTLINQKTILNYDSYDVLTLMCICSAVYLNLLLFSDYMQCNKC